MPDEKRLRWDVRLFPRLASTNATLRDLAIAGALEGVVVVADEQTAGRGRHGRTWSSPPGAGFYGSLLLRPRLHASEVPSLTFVAALAVAEMLEALGVGNVELKWPNDVLAGGRKISGILTEAAFVEDRVEWAVVGVGVNLSDEAIPADPRTPATSLASQGVLASSVDVLRRLLEAFEREYALRNELGFASTLERWLTRAPMAIGATVTVDDGRESFVGTTAGTTPDGLLRVRLDDGRIAEFSAADVSLGGQ